MTAPERMWAPTSEPFSSTTTESSLAVLGGELLQADGGGEPGRARADDDHVELHGLARRQLVLLVGHCPAVLQSIPMWLRCSIGRAALPGSSRKQPMPVCIDGGGMPSTAVAAMVRP